MPLSTAHIRHMSAAIIVRAKADAGNLRVACDPEAVAEAMAEEFMLKPGTCSAEQLKELGRLYQITVDGLRPKTLACPKCGSADHLVILEDTTEQRRMRLHDDGSVTIEGDVDSWDADGEYARAMCENRPEGRVYCGTSFLLPRSFWDHAEHG